MKLLLAVLLVAFGVASGRVRSSVDHTNQDKHSMVNTNRSPKHHGAKPKANWMDTCSDCKMIVGRINTMIDDQGKIDELKMVLNLLCDTLPSSSKEECKNFVSNIDTVIHELKPLLADPQRFCASIDLCGTRHPNRFYKALTTTLKYKLFASEKNDALCDECKFALAEAKAAWDSKSIQTEAKDLIEQLCNMLGKYKDQCDSLVDAYFPLLVQEIDALLSNPDGTCKDIGLCQGARFTARGHLLRPAKAGKESLHVERQSSFMAFLQRWRRVQTKAGDSTGCSVCVYSIGALLETLKLDPQLLQSWASGIQNLCTQFPTSYQAGCNDFLHIYLEPVLRVAVDSLEAKKICTLIKACTASTYQAMMEYKAVGLPKGKVGNEVVCESCRLLAEFLKTECQSSAFQDEVKTELKQVCNFVPGQYADQCDALIQQYTPYLFNLVVTELDPDTVCPELSLCPQSSILARPAAAKIEEAVEAEVMLED